MTLRYSSTSINTHFSLRKGDTVLMLVHLLSIFRKQKNVCKS